MESRDNLETEFDLETGAESAEQEVQEETAPAVETDVNVEQLTQERDEYLDMAQRIKAEFDNFKRRNQAARSEAYEDGLREMIAQYLPVIDNLERALDAAADDSPMRSGVDLVHKQMLEVLEKKGVTVIDRVGEPFDPMLENAVMQVEGDGPTGRVAQVMQKGYRMGDKVIRHAMVSVIA